MVKTRTKQGQTISFDAGNVPPPPRPSVDNFLEGLDIFWSQLSASNGGFEVGGSLLKLTQFTASGFGADTKNSLQKKGWIENPIDKSMMFAGTF